MHALKLCSVDMPTSKVKTLSFTRSGRHMENDKVNIVLSEFFLEQSHISLVENQVTKSNIREN
jgi:hypothetical protein